MVGVLYIPCNYEFYSIDHIKPILTHHLIDTIYSYNKINISRGFCRCRLDEGLILML